MIIGLGTDLVDIARIRDVYARHQQRFLERTYTSDEQAYCQSARDPAERLAARWAAKEAVMKVLGTGWTNGIRFVDIEVKRNDLGAPSVVLHHAAADQARALGIAHWHLSLSHTDSHAMAVAIGESAT